MSYATIASVVISAAGTAYSSYSASKNKPPGSSGFTGAVPTPFQFNQQLQAEEKNLLGDQYDPNSPYGFAQQFANAGTAQNIALQNKVAPGSKEQRKLATNQLNSYIQGLVPQDVQQNINRQVAQNLGGGFNLFSGGGQAPQNFARNLGQTSLGLSQFGLSAAPTWQQLANTMVVSPVTGAQVGLQAGQLANQQVSLISGQGMGALQNQYQAGFNQYQANALQNQQNAQLASQLGQNAIKAYTASQNAYGSGSPQQGTSAYSNQFGQDNYSSAGFAQSSQDVINANPYAIPAYYSGGGQSGYYPSAYSSTPVSQ